MRPGSELLVGLPVRPRPPTHTRPLANEQSSSEWSVLGLVSAPILAGLSPIAEPAALAPLVATSANDQNLSIGYIGNGRFIQAPHTGDYVRVSSLADPSYALRFVGAVRPY